MFFSLYVSLFVSDYMYMAMCMYCEVKTITSMLYLHDSVTKGISHKNNNKSLTELHVLRKGQYMGCRL